jgi:hypothetical protein
MTFGCTADVNNMRRMDAEAFKLYYTPRQWLVHNQGIDVNLYGEPGDPIVGSDGVTSALAVRRLTSAASDFVTEGVVAGSLLEINTPSCNDNGRYLISQVIDLHTLLISQNWPVGGNSGLIFRVLFAHEKYTAYAQLIPFQLRLDPSDKILKKYGLEQKDKAVDAMFKMSIMVCEEYGLTPKVGDRFNYNYGTVVQQYEVLSIIKRDQLADTGIPLHYIGVATKTRETY